MSWRKIHVLYFSSSCHVTSRLVSSHHVRSLESHQKLAQCVEVREEVAQLRTRVNQGDHLQDQLKAAMHRYTARNSV